MKISNTPDQLYTKLEKAIKEAPVIPPCQVTDPELWFAEREDNGNHYRIAKKLCQQCPVVNECLEYAIKAGEQDGVWGGLAPRERQQIRNKHLKLNLKGRPRLS
jgi:WhiB family redox-sensing transcriptional regulator